MLTRLKNFFTVAAIGLGILGILTLIAWWPLYKYSECRKVGHSKFYCVMTINQ